MEAAYLHLKTLNMYWWQSDEEVQKEIRETVKAIKEFSEELRAKGPEVCRQFLIDAGIIDTKEQK